MTSLRWLLRGLIFLLSLFLPAWSDCSSQPPKFTCTANSSEQLISFSSNGSDMDSTFEWDIEAESSNWKIAFRITDFFQPAGSKDSLSITNGNDNNDVMRWVNGEPSWSEEQTSQASSISVTFTIKLLVQQPRGFVLKYRAIEQDVQRRRMAVYSTGHYILMAVSVVVFILLAGSVICLVRRERMREQQKREKAKREKLGRRRKGISGISGWELSSNSPDPTDTIHTDTTSFVESLGLGSSTLSV